MENAMSVRRRGGGGALQNGVVTEGEKTKDPEFAIRESPLTVLIEHSLHIRAIYHIFVVILLLLLCDTVVYDLVERGKINIGITTVVEGFRDIGRSITLWLFELAVAVSFYPGLHLYAAGRKLVKKNPALCKIWSYLGFLGVVALEVVLIFMTIHQLVHKYHALASTVAVTCEMFRFAMKIWDIAKACTPRCHDESKPLPTFSHFIYFLFAPTLLYRDNYPRTKRIRWEKVVLHFLEVAAIVFYNSFLFERFILPYWSDYGKEPQVEAGSVVRGMFACVLPGVISFLCGFYCLLHAWLNAFAEMLTFGDRLFYEEWWISSQFSRYYRAWNRVVHSWLREHIYIPLAPNAGRAFSTFTVFIISAIAHEVVLALSFGFFYPVLLLEFGVFGLLMLPLTASGRRFPSVFNLIMWLTFFIGNGVLWSLYPMEYFARKNCPPSESDSFFVPKSWSCPEIVMKPNWKFQNPFELIH
ncbi:sterol O-acyltransferase 1 isoform X3 [Aricia agestis]|uniref:sterol O-acyltransferase 1 isoform X3 n=1 Tax=Aricia agestis TaxID=91739 RepID=UPI001C20610C|nr:sterol O-acyltransferase 1 isoform X3 [Aricia agestis]